VPEGGMVEQHQGQQLACLRLLACQGELAGLIRCAVVASGT
jgi:hypothetical protein